MRKAFVETLISLAETNDKIILLTADLGYGVLEPFADKFPTRFWNVGVAEQNMIGVATGLAEAGFIPYCYSIACFSVLRPLEFIRNGPIQHQFPVRIIGMGAGMDYSTNGYSHYGLEDAGILRTMPGITIVIPADSLQTVTVFRETANEPGPVYYRLSKNDQLQVSGLNGMFSLSCPQLLLQGGSTLLACMGGITATVLEVAKILRNEGIDIGLAVFSTLQPWKTDEIAYLLGHYDKAVAIEAHFINGGLGTALAETIAESGIACRLLRCGVKNIPDGRIGSNAYMMEINGLSPTYLYKKIKKFIADKNTTI